MTDDRYARQALIPGWSQPALAAANVIVVGVGALGNEVSRILALSGIGRLMLCDPDRIEASNLSRCGLFHINDVGQYKVTIAEQTLRQLAPDIHIDIRPKALIHGIGLAELKAADLVLGCLDSRAARLQLAGRCNLVQAPYIDGGTHPWGGEVRVYTDPAGPCYGCGLSPEDRAVVDTAWSCMDESTTPMAATAASSALIASWMGLNATRFLMGLSCPSDVVKVDGIKGEAIQVRQQRDADCPLHHPLGAFKTLPISALDTVGELLAAVEPNQPLAWSPMQHKIVCSCGYQKTQWGLPTSMPCPACHGTLLLRTTLELASAPHTLTLDVLGVAPGEILAVRTDRGIDWVALRPSG